MQASITVFLPKGRSGLNAPIRSERPAARRIAPKVLGLWSLAFELSTLERHHQRFESKDTKTKDPRPPHYVVANSLNARSVYCRAICLRQFITKSVLSSGRALT